MVIQIVMAYVNKMFVKTSLKLNGSEILYQLVFLTLLFLKNNKIKQNWSWKINLINLKYTYG